MLRANICFVNVTQWRDYLHKDQKVRYFSNANHFDDMYCVSRPEFIIHVYYTYKITLGVNHFFFEETGSKNIFSVVYCNIPKFCILYNIIVLLAFFNRKHENGMLKIIFSLDFKCIVLTTLLVSRQPVFTRLKKYIL